MSKILLRSLLYPVVLLIAASSGWSKTAVVLSTDVGNEIDDQWAITYMLTSPDFDVRGILSAHAPSLPAPSAHASFEILKTVVEGRLGMATHPPLFEGSSLPLADRQTARPNDAVNFLIATSRGFSADNRLTVLTIGAATDVASALILDPTVAQRIRLVAMGFQNQSVGKEYNVENDPRAWQVILDSEVPVTIGSGDVCRANLALTFAQAKALISEHGPVGAWLWAEYQDWYYRSVKPLRVDDFSKPWIIWDIITLAYLEGLTKQEDRIRPELTASLMLKAGGKGGRAEWITSVDSNLLWKRFIERLDAYQRSHQVRPLICVPN